MSTPAMTAQSPAADRAGPDHLRTTLRIDSWSTAVFGVVMLVGGKWLSDPLGLPTTWSVPFGVAMLGGAAALALVVGYPKIPFRLAATVVVGNILSCVALVLLAFTDVVPLTGLGRGFMAIGAVVVAVFAEFELVGLRRSSSSR